MPAQHIRTSVMCRFHVGEWLSLVEHLVRDQGVGGSNPLSPTNYFQEDTKDFWSPALSGVGDFVAVKTSKINKHISLSAPLSEIEAKD